MRKSDIVIVITSPNQLPFRRIKINQFDWPAIISERVNKSKAISVHSHWFRGKMIAWPSKIYNTLLLCDIDPTLGNSFSILEVRAWKNLKIINCCLNIFLVLCSMFVSKQMRITIHKQSHFVVHTLRSIVISTCN